MGISSVKITIAANIIGQGLVAIIALAAIPIYLRFMGAESYGIIGFCGVIQLWAVLLDFGVSSALTKEIAALKGHQKSNQHLMSIIACSKRILLGTSVLIVTLTLVFAKNIASDWLIIESLNKSDVIKAINCLGFIMAFRLWEEFYRGILRGAGDVVWINFFQVFHILLRTIGAIIIVAYFSYGIAAFFVWQAAIGLLALGIIYWRGGKVLPLERKARFYLPVKISEVGEVLRFSFGLAFISALGVIISQIDKLLLSGMLQIKEYGFYMLATLLSGVLVQFMGPINLSLYPWLSELLSGGNNQSAKLLFNKATQLVNVLVAGIGIFSIVFSNELILLWTGDIEITKKVAPIFNILMAGSMLNAFVNLPYLMHQSLGINKYGIKVNLVALVVVIPSIIFLVPVFGVLSAAYIWLGLNCGYFFISTWLIFKEHIHGSIFLWYKHILASILMALMASILCYFFYMNISDIRHVSLMMPILMILVLFFTLLSQPFLRAIFSQKFKEINIWK